MTRLLKYLAAALLAIALAGGAAGYYLWTQVNAAYKGYQDDELFVQIPQGQSTIAIGRRLVEDGVVRDSIMFRVAAWWSGRARSLKAGEYRFDHPMSPLDVIDKLARGEVYVRKLTFPEGLTIAEMAAIFESQGFGPAAGFTEAAQRRELIADLDPLATDLEGYLFPETYSLPRGTSPATLVALMVDRFRASFPPDLRAKVEAQGLSTRQIVTLASLVEKETAADDERPLVAAVYRNRMKIGMAMQADPTVIYALRKAGRYDGNIRRADLQFDSPYNTYRYPGLPPGPIAAPGRASLVAAAEPADVNYLYFVSRNDGTHVFAATLAEHNRNVRRFQVEYFRLQRQRNAARQGNAGADGDASAR
jgi:UPF0755 protein